MVQDLHHSIILGIDFMNDHDVTLNIRAKQMIFQDNLKVCSLRTNTGYARTVKPTYLKAQSEIDIQVRIARVNQNEEILLEPLTSLCHQNIMGAKCLVRVKNKKAIIRLINPTNRDINIKSNKVLAIVSQINKKNIFSLDSNSGQEKVTQNSKLNKNEKHFDFDLKDADLNETQKQKMQQLLKANNDVFAEGLKDLGRTHLQRHEIHTGDAPPVKLPFYPQPPVKRREITRQTDEMLKHGIIQESNSSWHSPVVLINKASSDEYRFAVDYIIIKQK